MKTVGQRAANSKSALQSFESGTAPLMIHLASPSVPLILALHFGVGGRDATGVGADVVGLLGRKPFEPCSVGTSKLGPFRSLYRREGYNRLPAPSGHARNRCSFLRAQPGDTKEGFVSIRERRKSKAAAPPIVSKIRGTHRRPVGAAMPHPHPLGVKAIRFPRHQFLQPAAGAARPCRASHGRMLTADGPEF